MKRLLLAHALLDTAAAVRGVYAWFKDGGADLAILYTMVAVISVFVIINHGVATVGD